MEIRFIAPIKNVSFNSPFQFDGFVFTNEKQFVQHFFEDKRVVGFIGVSNMDIFYKENVVYYEGYDFTELSQAFEIAERMNGILYILTMAFWFVKDNSITTYLCYVHLPHEHTIAPNTRGLYSSNASGKYETAEFSSEEIESVKMFMNLVLDYHITNENEIDEIRELHLKDGMAIATSNFLLFNSISRIQKAIRFIGFARNESLIPKKIAFYITVLEALFTTDNEEVNRKTTERTTIFIANHRDIKSEIYQTVKSAYDIRSKFFHGAKLHSKVATRDEQIKISVSLDSIVRQVIRKAMLELTNVFESDASIDSYFSDKIKQTNRERLKELASRIATLNKGVLLAEIALYDDFESSVLKKSLDGNIKALNKKKSEYESLLKVAKIESLDSLFK